MKKFLLTAAVAVAVASPAMAATTHHARHNATQSTAQDSYAYVADPDAVVAEGQVVGRDPDVFIRESLVRENDLILPGSN